MKPKGRSTHEELHQYSCADAALLVKMLYVDRRAISVSIITPFLQEVVPMSAEEALFTPVRMSVQLMSLMGWLITSLSDINNANISCCVDIASEMAVSS